MNNNKSVANQKYQVNSARGLAPLSITTNTQEGPGHTTNSALYIYVLISVSPTLRPSCHPETKCTYYSQAANPSSRTVLPRQKPALPL
ncbi:hypothetical protein VTH06DRAFT_8580 [Thermothelomyces fergusii]